MINYDNYAAVTQILKPTLEAEIYRHNVTNCAEFLIKGEAPY